MNIDSFLLLLKKEQSQNYKFSEEATSETFKLEISLTNSI